MASITIRNLDDEVKKRLRKQAAGHGRSLEAEARVILSRNVRAEAKPDSDTPKTGLDLFRGIREVVEKYGGVELEIPSRKTSLATEMFEDVTASSTRPRRNPGASAGNDRSRYQCDFRAFTPGAGYTRGELARQPGSGGPGHNGDRRSRR